MEHPAEEFELYCKIQSLAQMIKKYYQTGIGLLMYLVLGMLSEKMHHVYFLGLILQNVSSSIAYIQLPEILCTFFMYIIFSFFFFFLI